MARPRKQLTGAEKVRDIETYTHDGKKRTNNPPAGMAQNDKTEEKLKTYQFDPHTAPTLQWAGKAEGTSFDVPTSSIHIHESIKPLNIIARMTKEYSEAEAGQVKGQLGLFEAETPAERMRRREFIILPFAFFGLPPDLEKIPPVHRGADRIIEYVRNRFRDTRQRRMRLFHRGSQLQADT